MRFKRRYFCVELVSSSPIENKIKPNDLSQEINRSIERFYGDYGAATMQPSFSLIYFNSNTNLAILRIARHASVRFHQVLAFSRSVQSVNVAFNVIHVAGSIKKCKKFLLDFSSRRLEELYVKQANSSECQINKDVVEVLGRLLKACEDDSENFY